MSKEFGNADWIARGEGRVPTKGAMAAERASAGLGATDHDAEMLEEQIVLGAVKQKLLAQKRPDQRRSVTP